MTYVLHLYKRYITHFLLRVYANSRLPSLQRLLPEPANDVEPPKDVVNQCHGLTRNESSRERMLNVPGSEYS